MTNKPKKEGEQDFSFLLKEKKPFDFTSANEVEIMEYINQNFPESFPEERKRELLRRILEKEKKIKQPKA